MNFTNAIFSYKDFCVWQEQHDLVSQRDLVTAILGRDLAECKHSAN
ncbi:MAG TPA: hypothetical protein VJJ83_01240 [Candidatus Babeliales bacterium]|nr:hypothetical protein [Candidatus Babeliales bacterium]